MDGCMFTASHIIIVFLCIFIPVSDTHTPQICKYASCQRMSNSSSIIEYCKVNNMTLSGRCCFNSTSNNLNILTGIDMAMCNISKENMKILQTDLKTVQYLVLDDNPLYNCSKDDFRGLTELNFLSVPSTCSCPGELTSWEEIIIRGNSTTCEGQITCRHDLVPCPAASHCIGDGPGLAECLCNEGHYGYKCSRQGTFPTVAYLIGFLSSTVVLSGIMWFTQEGI